MLPTGRNGRKLSNRFQIGLGGRYAPSLRFAALPPCTHRLRNSHSEPSFKIVLKSGPGFNSGMQDHLHVQKTIARTVAANRGGTGDPAPGTAVPAPLQAIGHTNVKGAPGRTRTDTSDPFRGAASALGLRGLANNTPQFFIIEGLPYSDRRVSLTRFIQLAITVHRVRRVTVPPQYINAA